MLPLRCFSCCGLSSAGVSPEWRLSKGHSGLTPALRKLCGMRTAAVCSALTELSAKGEVVRDARGYQLKLPFPVSRPIDPQGNGNGKHLCSSGG